MLIENSTTDEAMVISTKTKVAVGSDIQKSIQSNFSVLQNEFPKLRVAQVGPVVQIYHLKNGYAGMQTHEYVLETAYCIGRGKMVQMEPRSKLVMRELKKSKCVKHLFKGPVWETPWGEFVREVQTQGAKNIREIREIYRVFKGGSSLENEIELQIVLE